MGPRARRQGGNGLDAWPGYVDALSTLLMVIIFVLLVFVLAQAFLTATLAGRNDTLAKVNAELAQLSNAFALEKTQNTALRLSVSQLNRELAGANAARDSLTQQVASLDKTTQANKATIEAKLSDVARLESQARALNALVAELEQKARTAAAATMTEQERRAAVQAQLTEEQRLGDSARAQIALLNRQVEELKAQFAAVQDALGVAEQTARDKDLRIADLGRKLNAALVEKVRELRQFRSEFFGRLRALLAGRPGIQVIGDRFVFQSEVLFPLGSADLTPAGVSQMKSLAATIKDIAAVIPLDVHWILRVDGHTDPRPTKGSAFASNWELSAARAITVVKLLITFGVPPDHLAATGFGAFQPFAPGDSPEAYAKDRRIELRLTDR